MTTNEQIKELSMLIRAKESEISRRKLYLANPERYNAELAAETKKLEYQQAHVDRLRAIYEDGEEGVHRYYLEIEELKQRVKLLKNEDTIERFLKVQAQFNALTAEEQARLAGQIAQSEEHNAAMEEIATI